MHSYDFFYTIFLWNIQIELKKNKYIHQNINIRKLFKLFFLNQLKAFNSNLNKACLTSKIKSKELYFYKSCYPIFKKQHFFILNLIWNSIEEKHTIFFLNIKSYNSAIESYYYEFYGWKYSQFIKAALEEINSKNYSNKYKFFIYKKLFKEKKFKLIWVLNAVTSVNQAAVISNLYLPKIGSTRANGYMDLFDYNIITFEKRFSNELWLNYYFYLNQVYQKEKKQQMLYNYFFKLFNIYSIFYKKKTM